MADFGLSRFLGQGIRFATSKLASVYVGLRLLSDPSASFYLNLPTALPSSTTQALTVDTSGNMGYAPIVSGTVTSVGLSAPSFLSVTGSPITTSGTIALSLASQSQNLVFASPNGSTGAPTFRSLAAADIPTLTTSKLSDFDTAVRAYRLDQFAAPTGNVSFNSQRITGLSDPVGTQDAATKAYVDATAQGLDVKASVRVASTANVTLSSPGTTIDGITLATNDRILLKNQTTASQNGIYVFNGSSSTLTRSTDANTSAKVTPGLFTFVEEGSTNADSGWILTTDGTITLDTTSLSFTQFSGAGQITAGNGLTKTGNQIDVVGASGRIAVFADNIDIDSTYTGQASIVTLGTVTTGGWNGTPIAVAYGGTGATTAANARSNLGAPGVYSLTFTSSNISSGILTVTHNLNRQVVAGYIIADNNNQQIIPDNVTFTSANVMSVDLTSFGTISGNWTIAVAG